nr:erythromycin esterase family protein [Lachnospiraceae bacterium]
GGNARNAIFITGHCGHIAKVPQNAFFPSNMGSNLKEAFGEDYFVVGSDYYKTDCNMPGKSGRADHKFKSNDPLAKEANNYDNKRYLLQFSDIDGSDPINDELSHLKMGTLGESYSIIMRVSTSSSRITVDAQKAFDAVVFVYSAKPIKLLEK